MGGDNAPEATIAGAVRAVRAGFSVLLVGDEALLRPKIPRGVSLPILHAPEVISMDEAPVAAVRRKPGASVSVALQAVAEGRADERFDDLESDVAAVDVHLRRVRDERRRVDGVQSRRPVLEPAVPKG